MTFKATFNNISVISWQSVLLVEETGVAGENHWHVASHWQTLSLYTPRKIIVTYAHFQHCAQVLFCHNIHEMYASISDKIEQECILKVYHVFILYHIVVINIFKISIWRLESLITTCLLIWRHTLISQWKNVL
jgi:hypothetical protein